MSFYGDIFDPTLLEAGAASLLAAWMPAYVRELERQRGLPAGRIVIPSGPDIVTDPASPTLDSGQEAHMWLWTGDAEDIDQDGDGGYSAAWPLSVRVAVIAATHAQVRLIARLHAAAVRTLILQHGSLNGVADSVRWAGESYGNERPVMERTQSMCTVEFRVQVTGVAGGADVSVPLVPPGDPVPDPGDAPEVVDGTTTVTFLEPTESL